MRRVQDIIAQVELDRAPAAVYYILRANKELEEILRDPPNTLLVNRKTFCAVVWGHKTGIYFEK